MSFSILPILQTQAASATPQFSSGVCVFCIIMGFIFLNQTKGTRYARVSHTTTMSAEIHFEISVGRRIVVLATQHPQLVVREFIYYQLSRKT